MVVVIVSNCWFLPLLHYALGGCSTTSMRLLLLVIDTCIDVTYCVISPLAIFLPYYWNRDAAGNWLPVIYYYMDSWYTNTVSELQQVFITSWLDFISKFSALAGLLYHLYAVHEALLDAKTQVSRNVQLVHLSRFSKVMDALLAVWGFCVICLHIHATIPGPTPSDFGCLLKMQPWGVSGYSCACLEVSCERHDDLTLHQALSQFQVQSIQVLIISHCPKLHVPPVIQQLESLMMLNIYNSTIVSWSNDAALRASFHPHLRVIYLVRTNMEEIPPGLLADDFPPTVWDLEFAITNISTLPDVIVTSRRRVSFLLMESNPNLTEIPPVITKLPMMSSLFFALNGITEIREDIIRDRAIVQLYLDGNPIQHLPSALNSTKTLFNLGFRATNITEIPTAWERLSAPEDGHAVVLRAGGSPLCTSQSNRTVLDWLEVDCTSMSQTNLHMYPIADEDACRHNSRR